LGEAVRRKGLDLQRFRSGRVQASMPIIACTGQKGGSGKSTVALSLASELVARGLRVLLVDADPQGTARTWGAVALEAGQTAPTVVSMGADLYRPGQLPALVGGFDWVLIDTPPRHSETQRAALMVADLALLPCGPSASDAWALAESVDLVRAAQQVRPDLNASVLLTRKVAGTAIGKSARDVLGEAGLPVLRSELGFRVAYQEAPAAGLGPAQYAPGSEAAAEVRALTEEVLTLARVSKPQKRKR
jgi:chromosome partitioning protein